MERETTGRYVCFREGSAAFSKTFLMPFEQQRLVGSIVIERLAQSMTAELQGSALVDRDGRREMHTERDTGAQSQATMRAVQALPIDADEVISVKGIDVVRLLLRHAHREGRRVGDKDRIAFDDAEERTHMVGTGREPDLAAIQRRSGSDDDGRRDEVERCEDIVPGALDESLGARFHERSMGYRDGVAATIDAGAPSERRQRGNFVISERHASSGEYV